MSHDFRGTPRTFQSAKQHMKHNSPRMNLSKTFVCVTRSKEVWDRARTPPSSGARETARDGDRSPRVPRSHGRRTTRQTCLAQVQTVLAGGGDEFAAAQASAIICKSINDQTYHNLVHMKGGENTRSQRLQPLPPLPVCHRRGAFCPPLLAVPRPLLRAEEA